MATLSTEAPSTHTPSPRARKLSHNIEPIVKAYKEGRLSSPAVPNKVFAAEFDQLRQFFSSSGFTNVRERVNAIDRVSKKRSDQKLGFGSAANGDAAEAFVVDDFLSYNQLKKAESKVLVKLGVVSVNTLTGKGLKEGTQVTLEDRIFIVMLPLKDGLFALLESALIDQINRVNVFNEALVFIDLISVTGTKAKLIRFFQNLNKVAKLHLTSSTEFVSWRIGAVEPDQTLKFVLRNYIQATPLDIVVPLFKKRLTLSLSFPSVMIAEAQKIKESDDSASWKITKVESVISFPEIAESTFVAGVVYNVFRYVNGLAIRVLASPLLLASWWINKGKRKVL